MPKTLFNRLIPGALFSVRSAQNQRQRARARGELVDGPTDVRDTTRTWNRAAEGFRKHDPNGVKLAKLMHEVTRPVGS